MYFSYRYQKDGETISRRNTALAPEKAQAYLSRLEKELRALKLPAYCPNAHPQNAADSCISATWTNGDVPFIDRYDALAAQTVHDLLVKFAEETEAWVFSSPAPENGWRCPSCGMPNGSSIFCVECGTRRSAK